MGAKKKVKSQHTGFYWYMQSILPNLRREGRAFPNGMIDVVPVARPRWKMMTTAEKEPFERRAKEEKRKNRGLRPDSERLDNLGNIIGERKNQEVEFKKKRDADRRYNKTKWPPGEDIIYQKFYFISFEYLCEIEDPLLQNNESYLPREFGIIEWSMANGITKEYHTFIDPGGIPLGYRFTAINHSDERHQIPISAFELDDSNYTGMWIKVQNFINPSGELEEYPPLYCLKHEFKHVDYLMEWLYEHALISPTPNHLDRICVLNDMVQDVYSHGTNGANVVSEESVHDILTTHAFDYEPKTRCKFHEDLGIAHCALATAKKCSYSLSDSLSTVFDFDLTPAHVPDPDADRPTYTVIPPENAGPVGPIPQVRNHRPAPQRQSSTGPFASRDVRYNQGDDESDESDEDAYNAMFTAPKPVDTPPVWKQLPSHPVQYGSPTMDNEEDFPSLGGAVPKKFASKAGPPPPSALPAPSWGGGGSKPAENRPPSSGPRFVPPGSVDSGMAVPRYQSSGSAFVMPSNATGAKRGGVDPVPAGPDGGWRPSEAYLDHRKEQAVSSVTLSDAVKMQDESSAQSQQAPEPAAYRQAEEAPRPGGWNPAGRGAGRARGAGSGGPAFILPGSSQAPRSMPSRAPSSPGRGPAFVPPSGSPQRPSSQASLTNGCGDVPAMPKSMPMTGLGGVGRGMGRGRGILGMKQTENFKAPPGFGDVPERFDSMNIND